MTKEEEQAKTIAEQQILINNLRAVIKSLEKELKGENNGL
jgi:hypothetical protein